MVNPGKQQNLQYRVHSENPFWLNGALKSYNGLYGILERGRDIILVFIERNSGLNSANTHGFCF